METWELWDDLPATIKSGKMEYILTITKTNSGVMIQYANNTILTRLPLSRFLQPSLHEALDRMWLWWQEYKVKK